MTDYNTLPWRVGTKLRRTIYVVLPQTDESEHPFLGIMDTPELAFEAVNSHNHFLEKLAKRDMGLTSYSYAQKEELINDLRATREAWEAKPLLEEAILKSTQGVNSQVRSQRVFGILGISSDILGPQAEIPKIIAHAIDMVRNN